MTQKRAVTPTLSERCALKPPSKSNHAARMRQGYENCEFLPLRGVIHALCTDHHAGKCYNQGPAGVPGGGRAGASRPAAPTTAISHPTPAPCMCALEMTSAVWCGLRGCGHRAALAEQGVT